MASLSRLLSIPLFAAAVLSHAADQSTTLVGKWKTKTVSVPLSGRQAEAAKLFLKSSRITFSKNKSFTMLLGGPMTGTWKVVGRNVELHITEVQGQKMGDIIEIARINYANDPSPRHKAALDELTKPLMAVLSTDGKTLTLKPATGKAVVAFIKG
ncbi:MAG TPA: hypothetical protein VG944_07795 [Fimbriimonas sp.]|nr:hypothetical protein [Fimbriimonas sp.]